jgi:hypothetical protein
MSWSVSTPDSCYYPDCIEDIDKLVIPAGSEQDTQEGNEQLAAAKAAAKSLIESGAAGSTGGDGSTGVKFQTRLNGHANPNHVPQANFANDTITVSVSQVS